MLKSFESSTVTLRLLQIYAIFIIMRYKTVYSIAIMLWVFLTSFTKKHRIITKASMLIVLPSMLFQVFCFYFMSLRENVYKIDFDNMYVYGFMTDFRYDQLEYVIMIAYFCLHIYYERQVKNKRTVIKAHQSQITFTKEQSNQIKSELFSINERNEMEPGSDIIISKQEKEIKFINVLIAIISKYSDIFSLFILFWISMYTVNVIHLILAFFFLLFSIQMGTSISPNTKKRNSVKRKGTSYNFVKKFWVFLIIYVNFIIFLRYLWVVFIVPYCGNEFLSYPAVLFVGITYDYEISPSLGLVKEGDLLNYILFLL